MLIRNKKIAIIGGGPSGLTLARLLQIKGADVKVYERDLHKDARVQGGTLDLHEESGLKALQKAGLMDAFRANYRPNADKICILDSHATIFYDDHTDEKEATFGDEHFRPEIDRGPLRDILLASLEAGTVVWNSPFKSMVEVENVWQLTFQNGATATADIVVGADGGNSKIRPFITPIKPFYSGITIVEGSVYNAEKTTPKIHEILRGGKIFAFGNEQSIIVSAKGDGSLSFYTGCKTDEFWASDCGIDFKDKTQVLRWFKHDFSDWGAIWLELLDNDKTSLIVRPQYCMPLDQTWAAQSALTIVGDAAHLMPPYAGEGVNMAMLDALELSECLTNEDFKDVQSAIAFYEKQMRLRASAVAKVTMEQTASLHSLDAIDNMLTVFERH
jgi:2-polyprenyl-6-methoxyphenol hydroxylase-like FAD-dependent oxidoreductase